MRRKNGRFFLLGSVSPGLLTSISESLAGRVGVLELTPFIYSEVAGRRGMKLENLWLRGGYPDALLARDPASWHAWQESYLRTFIEREQIAALEDLQHSGSAFYFFRTHTGAEIDLLIDRGSRRVGFEFKAGVTTDPDDWKHLQAGIEDGVIHRGYVVYNGTREFPVSDDISVIPATQILSGRLD
jgi:predicted AAA+ superfamily ATPase